MKPDQSGIEKKLVGIPNLSWLVQVGIGPGKPERSADFDYLAGCLGSVTVATSLLVVCDYLSALSATSVRVSDDAVCCILDGATLTVALCDPHQHVIQIKEYCEGRDVLGQRRPWAVGYWIPEALCADWAFCRVCYDPTGVATDLARALVMYPQKLSEGITDLCLQEIQVKTTALLERNPSIERELYKADVVAALIRLAFAKEFKYLRGFKDLESQSQNLSPKGANIYSGALTLAAFSSVIDPKFVQSLTAEVARAQIDDT